MDDGGLTEFRQSLVRSRRAGLAWEAALAHARECLPPDQPGSRWRRPESWQAALAETLWAWERAYTGRPAERGEAAVRALLEVVVADPGDRLSAMRVA